VRTTAKIGAVVAAGALAVAVPAAAHPAHPSKPSTTDSPPATSHKCAVHHEAYIASGTIVSWSATATNGLYNGTVSVAVTRTNHHAAPQKGTTYTYTLTNAKVQFGKGTSSPYTGDRVKLIGSITTVAKKCTNQSSAGTITVRKVDVSAPKPTT
jgi:hypothetical protein